MMGFKILAN